VTVAFPVKTAGHPPADIGLIDLRLGLRTCLDDR
jgi:hypothetical protein